MRDVEVRQLRYFVAVAEELHFGRAAERLGMAQPPLSRAIRELEHQLGTRLFERTTRRVDLTPAGQVLLRDARIALDAVTTASRRVRRAGRREPTLRLALKADYDAGLLPEMLAAYAEDAAALTVDLLLGGRGEQAPALRDGRADVAIIPSPFDRRGLDVEPLLTETRVLAVATTDPLADREHLRLADLAGLSLPDGSPAELGVPGSDVRPFPDASDEERGSDGRRSPSDSAPPRLDVAQIFNLVGMGRMVLFPPLSVARRYSRPSVTFRTITDLDPCTLSVAWPEDSSSPAVAAFVRAATAVATRTGPEDHQLPGGVSWKGLQVVGDDEAASAIS